MKTNKNYLKVAFDMSWLHLSWLVWFVVIVCIVYVVMGAIGGNIELNGQDIKNLNFLTFIFRPAKIAMLVIGIISASSFLTFYIKQGVTRKDFFYGGTLTAIAVSCILMLVAGVFSLFIELFTSTTAITFLGSDTSWIVNVIVHSVNILIYYASGWMIGAGFYRDSGLGFLYIILAVVAIAISDFLWEFELKEPIVALLNLSTDWKVPISLSFLGSALLIGVMFLIVRKTTKKVRIKLK